MPTEKYQVKFKLLGGATVTKVILASSEKDAKKRAIQKWKASVIIKIEKI